jgi:hypothetical protein
MAKAKSINRIYRPVLKAMAINGNFDILSKAKPACFSGRNLLPDYTYFLVE